MKAEVTIGIPVYKSVDYIEKTMLSALSQTFRSIEYLIVDDCGNDGSLEVLSRLQLSHSRGGAIRIMHNEKNRGVSYCRNRIIDEAQGRYLYFLDSDDLIEPQTIQLLYDSIQLHQCEIAYGSYEIIDEEGIVPRRAFKKPSLLLDGDFELATYAFKNNNIFHVSVCNSLISLPFLKKTKIRFVEASYWEDMAFSTELAIKVRRAILVSDITYHYLHHSNSLSHIMKRERNIRDEIFNNVGILNYLKNKVLNVSNYKYMPYLCYNLELNSFYAVCNIIKKSHLVVPMFTSAEMRDILSIPLGPGDILKFGDKRFANLLFWLMGVMPTFIFKPAVYFIGKVKRAI